ncbi:spore protease [Clostridium collagenovorans DSM 3089]|uniref:Germination protease n=1 Tax=Clostridium collagenovorans DSM 3089 TaxID=1121306 RepID=A0A1M5XQQ0_9CLOT|nr:GPR endopeptidase [Clostridium collagenovorans]SHI02120.1 spore protease [Clostridium collagenovorans DSM 3089]
MGSIRTDLAIEAQEMYKEKNSVEEIPGTEVKEYRDGAMKVTHVKILDNDGELAMGKPKGDYITIDMPIIVHYDNDSKEEVSRVLSRAMKPLIKLDESMTALVVGLGNWNITPDAIGPKVVSQIMITRHLKQLVPDSIDEEIRPVCAIAPGVLGLTGMETGEVIRGIIEKTKPDLVICVDALASRKTERVNRTIQVSNTGISPGAGVGNKRMELSERTLGIPVLAIGVPTVVDAATLANDTIDLVLEDLIKNATEGSEFYKMLKEMESSDKEQLMKEVLDPKVGDLMVTPKDVDMIIDSVSKIIAGGINISLQPSLSLEDINNFIN